jgi:hypothetical protein
MTAPAQTHPGLVDRHGQPLAAGMSTDHEAASLTRRFGTWGLSVGGPSAALTYNLASLRSRSRKLAMNEPQIDGGLDTLTANLIGTGITPRWHIEDERLKHKNEGLTPFSPPAARCNWSQWEH